MEYVSAIQKVSLFVESILQNAKQLQHVQFYSLVFGLKIIGHGNPDNNLESHCTTTSNYRMQVETLRDQTIKIITLL
jgi:hypothetical protein